MMTKAWNILCPKHRYRKTIIRPVTYMNKQNMANTTDIDIKKQIFVKNAHLNNLKHIDVLIPKNKLIVITGVSGSGKSSLAFDTIYAEGQRRYVESLSSYARQFLGKLENLKWMILKGLPLLSPSSRK